MRVLFPAPLFPTKAIFFPPENFAEKSHIASCGVSGYV